MKRISVTEEKQKNKIHIEVLFQKRVKYIEIAKLAFADSDSIMNIDVKVRVLNVNKNTWFSQW